MAAQRIFRSRDDAELVFKRDARWGHMQGAKELPNCKYDASCILAKEEDRRGRMIKNHLDFKCLRSVEIGAGQSCPVLLRPGGHLGEHTQRNDRPGGVWPGGLTCPSNLRPLFDLLDQHPRRIPFHHGGIRRQEHDCVGEVQGGRAAQSDPPNQKQETCRSEDCAGRK